MQEHLLGKAASLAGATHQQEMSKVCVGEGGRGRGGVGKGEREEEGGGGRGGDSLTFTSRSWATHDLTMHTRPPHLCSVRRLATCHHSSTLPPSHVQCEEASNLPSFLNTATPASQNEAWARLNNDPLLMVGASRGGGKTASGAFTAVFLREAVVVFQ